MEAHFRDGVLKDNTVCDKSNHILLSEVSLNHGVVVHAVAS